MSFQLTTSRRGRLDVRVDHQRFNDLSTHDLTQRSTIFYPFSGLFPVFQLTTSRRGRHSMSGIIILTKAFQLTTSRRGRLGHKYSAESCRKLSTHDLTQRSTFCSFSIPYSGHLSTHDLTQRSTSVFLGIFDDSEDFQLTTSRRGRQAVEGSSLGDESFQLTTSRRGRRYVST